MAQPQNREKSQALEWVEMEVDMGMDHEPPWKAPKVLSFYDDRVLVLEKQEKSQSSGLQRASLSVRSLRGTCCSLPLVARHSMEFSAQPQNPEKLEDVEGLMVDGDKEMGQQSSLQVRSIRVTPELDDKAELLSEDRGPERVKQGKSQALEKEHQQALSNFKSLNELEHHSDLCPGADDSAVGLRVSELCRAGVAICTSR